MLRSLRYAEIIRRTYPRISFRIAIEMANGLPIKLFPDKQLFESLLFDIEKGNAFQGEVATDDRLRKIRNALLQ